MKPVISIIIPCYNSGQFLTEAIESIQSDAGKDSYEVIIIDDGSTDAFTLSLLQELSLKYNIIHQENKGPAAARNTGIHYAQGEYILFLDSDNKVRPSYIDKGLSVLNSHQDVGVVYGNAEFFGDTSKPRFISKKFDLFTILEYNYIDMCSIVRKEVWQQVGGLDENRLLIGHEDWDFWIRIGNTNWKFFYINEVLFDYRIRANSLITEAILPEKYRQMRDYIYCKNIDIIMKCFKSVKIQLEYYNNDRKQPLRSFVKYVYNKYIKVNNDSFN